MKKYIIVIITLIGCCLLGVWGQQKQLLQNTTPTLYNSADSISEDSLVFSIPQDSVPVDSLKIEQIIKALDTLKKVYWQLLKSNQPLEKQAQINRPVEPEMTNKAIQNTNYEPFKLSFFIMGILGLCTILYFFLYRYFKNMDEHQDFPTDDVAAEKQPDITTDPPTKKEELPEKRVETTAAFNSNDNAYFFAEVMVTAGPRKNFNEHPAEGDFGVGEDVAGLICKREFMYFWVLDGTSDSEKIKVVHPKRPDQHIELFSSRLLAQTIAWNIQQALRHPEAAAMTTEHILHTAIAETQEEWKEKIEQLSVSSSLSLRELLRQRKNMQCSTTALLGKLSIHGQLEVCQIGDSSVLTHPPLQQTIQSRDRQFALLSLGHLDNIILKFNSTQSHKIEQDHIHTVLAMTDGMSYHTQNWLKELTNIDFSHPHIRKILVQQRPNTQDDKAICIIQIKT